MKRFGDDLRVPRALAGYIAAGCALVKEVAYQYTSRVAKRLDSSALRAVAWDHRSDALASGSVAISLFFAPHAGWLAPYVDPIAALFVCSLLVFTGTRIFMSTAGELMDQQADDDMVLDVRSVAAKVDGVADVEKLRVRKSGLEYFIEIHVQVAGHLTVNEGHRIGHEVKDQLLVSQPRVRDVHVHIEPYDEPCDENANGEQ